MLSTGIENKIRFGNLVDLQKKSVLKVLTSVCKLEPSFKNVLEEVHAIHIVQKETTYKKLIDSILKGQGWGEQSIQNFYQTFPFKKPYGYTVRGMTFPSEKVVILNMEQVVSLAEELADFLKADERRKKRDRHYFFNECHCEQFTDKICDKHDAVVFLFWQSLLEQLRCLQQSLQTLDLSQYGYLKKESRLENDRIGFAQYMYERAVL